MNEGRINSITRLRIDADGTGVRSVVFMHGCPLRCFWCCNPEIRTGSDYRILDLDKLYEYIKDDVPYFVQSGGGITFSGGESLQQSDFIKAFAEKYGLGFSIDIETSLHAKWEKVEQLIPLVDVWNVDFKVADEELHIQYTGVSNRTIMDNLSSLAKRIPPEQIIITLPIIPGYNDSEEQLLKVLAFAKRNGLYRIALHPYRKIAEVKQYKCGLPVRRVNEVTVGQFKKIEELMTREGMSLFRTEYYYGKGKCEYLKKLRKDICQRYGISIDIPQCTFKDECIGTCPQCEAELLEIGKYLRI